MVVAAVSIPLQEKEIVIPLVDKAIKNIEMMPLINKGVTKLYKTDNEYIIIFLGSPFNFIDPIYIGTILSALFFVMHGTGVGFWIGLGIICTKYFFSPHFMSFLIKKAFLKKKKNIIVKRINPRNLINLFLEEKLQNVPV
jgi:hypothetical protein